MPRPREWRLAAALCFGMLAGLPRLAIAQDRVVLIVNAANPVATITRDELSKMFLLRLTRWPNGQHVQPVDGNEMSPVRRHFSDTVLRMDVPSVKSFWQEIVFSGRGTPPPERVSEIEIIGFVKKNPGAIGYVSSITPVDGVKVITLTASSP
ncbi:MAG: hypothetical protein ABJE10_03735 [bacterium]